MTWIGARWPSMWSRPAWLSSSTTKMAESFQTGLCVMVSMILPVARSLSATWAAELSGPPVWSLDSQNMFRLAGPFCSKSCFQISYRYRSGMLVSNFGYAWLVTLFSDGIGEEVYWLIVVACPGAFMFFASQ